MRNCDVVLGFFRFIIILCARVGAMWTEEIEDSEVEADWVS